MRAVSEQEVHHDVKTGNVRRHEMHPVLHRPVHRLGCSPNIGTTLPCADRRSSPQPPLRRVRLPQLFVPPLLCPCDVGVGVRIGLPEEKIGLPQER